MSTEWLIGVVLGCSLDVMFGYSQSQGLSSTTKFKRSAGILSPWRRWLRATVVFGLTLMVWRYVSPRDLDGTGVLNHAITLAGMALALRLVQMALHCRDEAYRTSIAEIMIATLVVAAMLWAAQRSSWANQIPLVWIGVFIVWLMFPVCVGLLQWSRDRRHCRGHQHVTALAVMLALVTSSVLGWMDSTLIQPNQLGGYDALIRYASLSLGMITAVLWITPMFVSIYEFQRNLFRRRHAFLKSYSRTDHTTNAVGDAT
ncbi:MAG: hypothetical protein AAF745_03645 [Planctomycetota bacterium]